jgi:hypothetical protein
MKATVPVIVFVLIIITAVFSKGCADVQEQKQNSQITIQDKMQNSQPVPEPTQIIKDLRNQILTSSPKELGFNNQNTNMKVYGVLMEIGYEGIATLVSLRDGNASIYLDNGGGIIGGVGHESVRKASIDFVKESEKYLSSMQNTKSFPYSKPGQVKFYLLTFDGVLTAEADEAALGEGSHKLSPLFYKGDEVITQLGKIYEEKK